MTPQFGVDFAVGYIGFTYVSGIVSSGVAYFERWHRCGPIPITHTLIVSGENECIEAHIDEGVARAPLMKYFNDPNCRIVFRRPRGWDLALGARIVSAASDHIGCHYNTELIIAEAAADTLVGHLVNRLLRGWPNRVASKVMDRPNHWICSQLVADALARQPEFQGLGVLGQPLDTIDPQQLFEDTSIFEDGIPSPV